MGTLRRHLVLLGLGLLTALPAFAETQIIFSKDGARASVIMASLSVNPDAVAFFDFLTVPEEDFNGKRAKKFAFKKADGAPVVDAVCVFSRLVNETGSCTITFHAGLSVSLNGSVHLEVIGTEAQTLAGFFRPGGGEIFRSTDGHFSVFSGPSLFQMDYR
jgi:hypothetical protein